MTQTSSPAKRRRKNDYTPGTTSTRGIDYFFAKQRGAASAPKTQPAKSSPSEPHSANAPGSNLSQDEILARKLQDEWNQEIATENALRTADDSAIPLDPEQAATTGDTDLNHRSATEPAAPFPSSTPGPKVLSLQSTATDEDKLCASIPFDENTLSFNPSAFLPDLQNHWAADHGHATYSLLTRCFVLVNATTSRIKIVDTLTNLLRTIIEADPGSLLPAVWLATNAISPSYVDLELGLGGSSISKALRKVCGLDNAGLRALYAKHGDAGDVAFEAKKRQSFTLRRPKPLTIRSVYESLVRIAKSKGQGSQEMKQRIVERLIQDTRGAEESRYIVRTLVQHLRIGAVRTTMLIALSRAFLLSRPPGAQFSVRDADELKSLKKEELADIYHSNEEIVKACFARHPNYADLIPALLEVGVCPELLVRCGLSIHIPLRPMLGSITRDLGDMLNRLQGREFSCEYKYDGQRAQVHCDDSGKVSVFSRHLELMTDKYPDLVALVPKFRGEGVRSFILEGEVVAIDTETGELRPFQELSNRARKDVDIHAVTVNVCLFAFDLMFLNGEELLDRSFRERRNLLRSLFVEIPHHFTWAKHIDATSADSEAVLDIFKAATTEKCEGIMVKVLDNVAEGADEEDHKSAPTTPRRGRKSAKCNTNSAATDDIQRSTKPASARRKALLSTYEPDKRLESWLKVKKDYHVSADTIDLVPIAAWHGHGRKSKWWSPILMAARDPTTGELVAVTKCMSGFTDVFYAANRRKYDPNIGGGEAGGVQGEDTDGDGGMDDDAEVDMDHNVISRPHYVRYSGPEPAVWFKPQEVWEMAFADVTLSPTYTAALGLVSEERGLSLRFPRFLRVREDKGVEEASTEDFLAQLYRKQVARGVEAAAEKDLKVKDPVDDEDEHEG